VENNPYLELKGAFLISQEYFTKAQGTLTPQFALIPTFDAQGITPNPAPR
jgi:hypothetical protein